jgi:small-conductance mechanosensitive channel
MYIIHTYVYAREQLHMCVAHKYTCTRTHARARAHTHTHTAVKELYDEAARLRQTARSVSTENRLLLSALQDRERKMNLLQAANRELQEQLGEVTEREGEVTEGEGEVTE